MYESTVKLPTNIYLLLCLILQHDLNWLRYKNYNLYVPVTVQIIGYFRFCTTIQIHYEYFMQDFISIALCKINCCNCSLFQSRLLYRVSQIIYFLYGPRQANLVLIAYASSEGSGEPAHPRSLARTFAARSYKQ